MLEENIASIAPTTSSLNSVNQKVSNKTQNTIEAMYLSLGAAFILVTSLLLVAGYIPKNENNPINYLDVALFILLIFASIFTPLFLKITNNISRLRQMLLIAILPVGLGFFGLISLVQCVNYQPKGFLDLTCALTGLIVPLIFALALLLFFFCLFFISLFNFSRTHRKIRIIVYFLVPLIVLVEILLPGYLKDLQKSIEVSRETKETSQFESKLKIIKDSDIKIDLLSKDQYEEILNNKVDSFGFTEDFTEVSLTYISNTASLWVKEIEKSATKKTVSVWLKESKTKEEKPISGAIEIEPASRVPGMELALSPQKTQLAAIALGRLYIINTDGSGWYQTQSSLCDLTGNKECSFSLKYSPDGVYIYDLDYSGGSEVYYKLTLPTEIHIDNSIGRDLEKHKFDSPGLDQNALPLKDYSTITKNWIQYGPNDKFGRKLGYSYKIPGNWTLWRVDTLETYASPDYRQRDEDRFRSSTGVLKGSKIRIQVFDRFKSDKEDDMFSTVESQVGLRAGPGVKIVAYLIVDGVRAAKYTSTFNSDNTKDNHLGVLGQKGNTLFIIEQSYGEGQTNPYPELVEQVASTLKVLR